MRSPGPLLLALLVLPLLVGCSERPPESGPASPDGMPLRTDVSPMPPGPLPAGFDAIEGEWSLAAGPDGATVVLQSARSPSSTYNLLLAAAPASADVDVSARLRPRSGKIDRGGGVVWRAVDGRNYYVCRWNPLESNYRVYKVIDGRRIQLASADAPDDAEWHEVRAEMRGDAIRCFLDGKPLLEVRDGDLAGAGRAGLWTKADAVTEFRAFRASAR